MTTTEAVAEAAPKPKEIDDDAMDALVKKLREEYGAEAVELRFEMPTGKDGCYDEFVFRYGDDPVTDEAGDEAEGVAGQAQSAA